MINNSLTKWKGKFFNLGNIGEIVQEKFLELFEPCKNKLWAFCLSLTNNKVEAEDIYSETILLAYENFSSLKEEKAFLAYVFRIAYRLNLVLSKRNKKYFNNEYIDLIEIVDLTTITNEQKVDVNIIFEVLAELKMKFKEPFLLSVYYGFPRKEIAEILNISENTVKMRLYRAKKQLRRLLKVDDIDCE